MEQNRKPRRNKKKRNPDIWSINYDKGGKNIQWNHFNKWFWENWRDTCKIIKLEYFITPHTEINLKLIKDLNVIQTIKFFRGKHRRTLLNKFQQYLFGSISLNNGNKKLNICDQSKLKSYCIAKEIKNKTKRKQTEWEKNFGNDSTNKGLIPKVYKQHI